MKNPGDCLDEWDYNARTGTVTTGAGSTGFYTSNRLKGACTVRGSRTKNREAQGLISKNLVEQMNRQIGNECAAGRVRHRDPTTMVTEPAYP